MTVSMSSFFSSGSMGRGGAGEYPGGTRGVSSVFSGAPGSVMSASASAPTKPTEIDPKLGSDRPMGIAGGAAGGAAIGSLFGPPGTAIGGLIGGVAGAFGLFDSSSSNDRRKAKKQATENSYAYGRAAYQYVADTTESINATYDKDLAAGRARLSGQGIEVEGSTQWDALQGSLSRTRTDALAGLDKELANFRAGDSLEWVKEDYELMTGIRKTAGQRVTKGNDKAWSSWRVGLGGRSGEQLFTAAQRSNLRGANQDTKKYLEKYAKMVAPGVNAYMQGKFGTDEQKAQFESDMDSRIATANTWFDRKMKSNAIDDFHRAQTQKRQDQRK